MLPNATLCMGAKRAPCSVSFTLEQGLRPGGFFKLVSGEGKEMALQLEPEAVAMLAAAIIVDPRFKVGGRHKPQADLEQATADLFDRIMKGQ